MMQQVASTKADVAAFAALQGANEQADPSSAFGQVLKQQQNPAPSPVPTDPDRTKSTVDGLKYTDDIEHKTAAATKTSKIKQTEKSAQSNPAPNLKADKDAGQATEVAQESETAINAAKKQDGEQTKSSLSTDQPAKDELAVVDEKNDEQALANNTEQWIDLVWSLQELSAADGQAVDAEIVNPLEIDSIEALQNWLEPIDDKLQALAQLIEAKPQIQTWLAEAGLSHSEELNSLFRQAISLTKTTASQVELKSIVGEDNVGLLKNNGLNPAQTEQVDQASDLTVKSGKNAKEMLNDMPIIFVPQTDESGKILEASSLKTSSALPMSKENIQALLDKLSGINSTSTGVASGQLSNEDVSEILLSKTIAATLVEPAKVSVQANPLANDKTTLVKDAAINPPVVNIDAVEITPVSNAELKGLLALSSEELDAALTSVAQRIAAILRDEKQSQSNLPNKTINDASTLATTSSKDILAALKAGVAEFKDQLAAGHEPGLDLKALVSQALDKTGDSGIVTKVAEGLDQSIRALSHSLAALNQLNDSAAVTINQAINTAAIDSQVTQAEQHKAMQLNQFDNKLDKAINLHKPEGHQQLAEKVRWMVNTSNLVAEIRLDPAELGSVHVKVSLSAESATVNFVVQSQQTRDALEAATPKLREMLAEKGIELGQSTVKQDSQAKQDGQADKQARNSATGLASDGLLSDDETSLMHNNLSTKGSSNVIDYFV